MTQKTKQYQKGDMQKTRWKLAIRRWLVNQPKRQDPPTLKNAPQQIATTQSIQATEGYKEVQAKKSTVVPLAATDSDNVTEEQSNGGVMDIVSPMTLSRDTRLCAFCFTPFKFKRSHATYCSETCKTDARLVRKAFRDRIARPYIKTLLSRNEVVK